MRKLKKELNKILKVFLALGLLFNNLMPLSVVFADELENNDEVAITEKVDDEGTLPAESDEFDEGKEENSSLDTDLENEEGEELSNEGDETTTDGEIDSEEPSTEEPASEVAFTYEVYVDDSQFEDDYGWVELDKDVKKLDIMAKLSGVEATEDYKFVLEETEYTTEDLLNGVVIKSLTFEGYLYGVFDLEIDGTLINPEGTEDSYHMNYVVEYGTENGNDEALSAVNEEYIFSEGVVTTTNYDEAALLAIAEEAFPNASAEIEDNELCLSDAHGVFAWYGIITKGDVNGDGKINQEDLELLIDQVLGLEEITENSDVNDDGEVNDLDVAYLKLMLETGVTEDITEEDVKIDAKFDEFSNPVKVGDEFTLNYLVTLSEYTINGISGLVKYDKDLLELISAKAKVFDLGDINDDKFLYLGEYLELDVEPEEDEDGNLLLDEDGSLIITFNDIDYVLVTLTFKALAPGETTVSVDEVKFFDYTYYYTVDGVTSIDVTIEDEEQEESPFTSIMVSGYDVDLNTYELTVPNDVTALELEYVLVNENYSVISVATPEELAEGENTIVITVADENGNEKVYTVKVTREASEEKEEIVETVSYVEPTYTYYDDDDDEIEAEPSSSDNKTEPTEVKTEDNGKLSRIVIIILILLAIAGLIYLIFRDDKDDEETKKVNRDIDKLKKEDDKKQRENTNNKKIKKKGR